MNYTCKHLMKSGKNKGKECGERGFLTFSTRTTIPYCFKHKDSHEEEWRPLEEAVAKKQHEKYTKEMEEYKSKLKSRDLSAQKIFDQLKERHISPNLFIKKEKNSNSNIVEEMDKVLNRIFFEDHRMTDESSFFSRLKLYPKDWCGYEKDEIMEELTARGFSPVCYLEKGGYILADFGKCVL
jgi:hypothetical protein